MVGGDFFTALDFEALPDCACPEVVDTCEGTLKGGPPGAFFNGINKNEFI